MVKNLLIIDETCHMCFLSDPCEGKAHDKSLADLADCTLPYGSCLHQDLGFQGYTFDGITIRVYSDLNHWSP
jgi:hypothetical protein